MVREKMTKTQQQKAVGQGLAVGCLSLGVTEVPYNKMGIYFAFGHAWSEWPWSSRFPSINASLQRNDLVNILHESAGRSGVVVAAWQIERTLKPYLNNDWDVAEAAEMIGEWYEVPSDGWMQLAKSFLDRLNRTPRQ